MPDECRPQVTRESLEAHGYPVEGGSGAVVRERLGNLRPLTDT